MEQFIAEAMVIDINLNDVTLLENYVDLDTHSRNHGRTMGKNDLWIAATAVATKATLLTSDNDFDHLAPSHLAVVKI